MEKEELQLRNNLVGNLIHEKRLALGYNINELAEKCYITSSYLCDIEHSKKNPTDDIINELFR